MRNYRVMIVDDSPFSRAILTETLREIDCEVVAEVDNNENLLDIYDQCQPDLITMDLVMPGADGFECSRALHVHDPNVKIVMVSSMKDEESENEAKRIGIIGYVQKPVDGETLKRVFDHIMTPDALFIKLQFEGLSIFKEMLAQNITRITKAPIKFDQTELFSQQFSSQGITTVIGIIGRHNGVMVLDFSTETAEKFVDALLHRPSKNEDEILTMVAELGNIIAGTACSQLNKMDNSYSLRVSPPSLFTGDTSQISIPSLNLQICRAESEFGRIVLGVGFKKGSTIWM